jgi:hypothetical protein
MWNESYNKQLFNRVKIVLFKKIITIKEIQSRIKINTTFYQLYTYIIANPQNLATSAIKTIQIINMLNLFKIFLSLYHW